MPLSRSAFQLQTLLGRAGRSLGLARGSSTPAPGSMDRGNVISHKDMKVLVDSGTARIIDVRLPGEVANGHIANSVNIPVCRGCCAGDVTCDQSWIIEDLKCAQADGCVEGFPFSPSPVLVTQTESRRPEVRSAGNAMFVGVSFKAAVAEVEEALKMDPETFKMKYGMDKPRLDDENLIFHCQMGRRGAQATEIAINLGYAKARNYAGGYKEWSEKEVK